MALAAGTAAAVIAAVLAVYLGLRQARPGQPAGPLKHLTLAAYAGDTGALVYIARENGYFAEQGLEVTIIDHEAGKLAADSLLAGEADVCTSAAFVFVSNSFDRPDLRILSTVATARINEMVARRDHGISEVGDLKGKRIAVTRKSSGEFFLGTFLLFNHLSLADITVVDLKPSEIVKAVTSGSVDAGFSWDPNIYAIKRQLGDGAVSWPGQSGQDFYFLLITTERWLENNRDAAGALLRSLVMAEDFVNTREDEAKAFIRKKFGYEKEYLDYSWQKQEFAVALPQDLLMVLEDQARWRQENQLTDSPAIPNYLHHLHLESLEKVRPRAVTVIH